MIVEKKTGWDTHWYSYLKIWWQFREVIIATKAFERIAWELSLRKDAKSLRFLQWAETYIRNRIKINTNDMSKNMGGIIVLVVIYIALVIWGGTLSPDTLWIWHNFTP